MARIRPPLQAMLRAIQGWTPPELAGRPLVILEEVGDLRLYTVPLDPDSGGPRVFTATEFAVWRRGRDLAIIRCCYDNVDPRDVEVAGSPTPPRSLRAATRLGCRARPRRARS